MGTITTNFANGLTTNGVLGASTINDNSISNITSIVGGGALKLISSQTASASASLSFTSGIDSTYKTYLFKIINMHPGTDNINFTFNFSTDGGSNYNVTKTTTVFTAYHNEADTENTLEYNIYDDIANGTGYQTLSSYGQMGIDNDQSLCSEIYLFSPSNTTFVKHFMCKTQWYQREDRSINVFTAGYCNTTSAINAVDFKMSSGNIDAGTIHMYGIA